jgi:hypothetical protein
VIIYQPIGFGSTAFENAYVWPSIGNAGGQPAAVVTPDGGRRKVRKPQVLKHRVPIYRHPEEVEREQRLALEEYLETLAKPKPKAVAMLEQQHDLVEEAPVVVQVKPRLTEQMARAADIHELKRIARAQRAAVEDRERARQEHRRRVAAATAMLMLTH